MDIFELAMSIKMAGGGTSGAVVIDNGYIDATMSISNINRLSIFAENVENITYSAFINCINLTSIDLPSATSIGTSAFANCKNLTSINLPSATSIGTSAFDNCINLTSIDLPSATSISDRAFANCINLTSIDLPSATSIEDRAFEGCNNLHTLILRNETMCEIIIMAVLGTKIANEEGVPTGEGFIYVPSVLYEDYVAFFNMQIVQLGTDEATAEYISRTVLRKIEDYPKICG